LVDYVYLYWKIYTVLKTWHKSYFDILPMPAPQSRTLPLANYGCDLMYPSMNFNEKLMSRELKLPYPPSTPLYEGYSFYLNAHILSNTSWPFGTIVIMNLLVQLV